MKIYRYPTKDSWKDLVKRPVLEQKEISALITEIFTEVKKKWGQSFNRVQS